MDNTAEATAAGALYSDAAGKFAVLAKTARNATIGFVVLGYALYWVRQHQGKEIDNKAAFLWQKFPKFVLGFIVISALVTAGGFTQSQVTDLANLSRWAFLLTFAGVGLRTNVRDLTKFRGPVSCRNPFRDALDLVKGVEKFFDTHVSIPNRAWSTSSG